MRELRWGLCALVTLACAAAGCGGISGSLSGTPAALGTNARGAATASAGSPGPIQHVIVMIQENRTFNDLFATFPGADGTTVGQAAAEPKCSPPIKKGPIALTESNLVLQYDLIHKFFGFQTAFDRGKMDGFDRIVGGRGLECTYPYQYTNPSQIAEYWSMARQYTLAEHMFTTQGSDSFTAHQDLIRGDTMVKRGLQMVDLPDCGGGACKWGCDAPPGTKTSLISQRDVWRIYKNKGPFPCSNKFRLPYPTLRDLLDAKGLSWKYYVPPYTTSFGRLMSAFRVVAPVRYGPEWKTNVSVPETNIFKDISTNQLAAVSWVVPTEPNSDHPGVSTDNGPSWVGSVVNAIGTSPYWSSTAIIIVWDDWGGLYDNVKPVQYGFGGLGPRVPAIIVSPYAKPGYISATNYEFGSIIRYIEENWNLGYLKTTDTRASSIADCFNYRQTPIKFNVIATRLSKEYFLHEKQTYKAIDDDI